MGRKSKKTSSLGRSLINDRFGRSVGRRTKDPSILHSSEVPDGYDWGRLNLKSVTEESSFQEFLSTAEVAGTEFQAEKLNITFVNPLVSGIVLTEEEKQVLDEKQEKNKKYLSIPRRPKWNENTTPEMLEAAENKEFLEWRRRLAILQEEENITLTPYEKNLEFWRQLWRVVERSDIVVQIVDARNPLLFHCRDLDNYVCEVSSHKLNLILLNKADFLTDKQRCIWAEYFGKLGIHVAFYSAVNALNEDEKKIESQEEVENDSEDNDVESQRNDSEIEGNNVDVLTDTLNQCGIVDDKNDLSCVEKQIKITGNSGNNSNDNNTNSQSPEEKEIIYVKNCSKLLTRSQLITFFRNFHTGTKVTKDVITIGLVGYPNVGKSSTINSLLMEKKVSVSATPGKTKHFQTLFLDKDLLLCDCPGLVMPSFVYSKADMIINGILPIDQMRDHVPPITLVASLIPRYILEDTYGIMIPPPMEGEDPSRTPTSEELLNAYGCIRGFMTQNGLPDNSRSSRYILKDFVNGKLLFCHAPPGFPQEEFHTFTTWKRNLRKETFLDINCKAQKSSMSDIDRSFFSKSFGKVHTKGHLQINSVSGERKSSSTSQNSVSKPWKDHSFKRNKREKSRKVYSHLDQH